MHAAPQIIYLASKSPRRRELLKQIGVRYELLMMREQGERIDIDESPRANEVPRTDQLERRLAGLERQDPFSVLGVSKTATRDQVRSAFIAKARAYHPDRYAREDLPSEILEYINAMARRVNGAYSELTALFGVDEDATV